MIPWQGGLNLSLDPSEIPSNQLTIADNVIFGVKGTRKKREGINFDWDSASNGSDAIIGLHDFWFGNASKVQRLVGVTDAKNIYSYTIGGTRSADLFAGTAWSSSLSTASFETLGNILVIAVDGSGNVMKKWTGTGNIADLGGTPPEASIIRKHLGRLFTNDKTRPDRLHYCTTGNPEEWNGTGDSGAIDIGFGDGDPEGITAIFPTFKGDLFVAKKTKLYRVSGLTPETFQITLVSSGIGCASHNSVVLIDQDDAMFISDKGVHSLSATANYGDFEGAYVSFDIQGHFNDEFVQARLKYSWGAYLNNINSVAFAVTDSDTAETENKSIWLYNIPLKSWYRWPSISCSSLIVAHESDRKRFYIGGSTTRVARSFNDTTYDVNSSGVDTAIVMRIKTGIIYLDDNPTTMKAFKWFGLIYKPRGTHTITVSIRIDNYPVQALSFSEVGSTDFLGTTFILGASILGYDVVHAPYARTIDGYGRGAVITIEQAGTNDEVDIQGFAFGFEPAEQAQEVILGAE